MGQAVYLCEEPGWGLLRILCRTIAAGKRGGAQVCSTFETALEAPHKDLAPPDATVVPEAGSVKADADNPFPPFAALGKNRRQVRSMVLYCSCLADVHRGAMAR